jgi:hypothetical protein
LPLAENRPSCNNRRRDRNNRENRENDNDFEEFDRYREEKDDFSEQCTSGDVHCIKKCAEFVSLELGKIQK